ncbi:MAG: hypothetical protein LC803_10765 [Acidobacteria bacterium]|nr:hypothetical protein [Acidobacteriota bacterium]
MIEQLELTPQNTIRLETAFSRFPVHKLARRGNINIEIVETTPTGEIKTKWGVDYPKKAGQPGPLAYKVDTLVVNRRIDDERPLIPKVIKLGSLSEICRELGMRVSGGNSNELKKAIHQNASAYITAKINYKTATGAENVIEAGFSRYSVIFTGEKLPDGRKANAVYLILNDVYLKVLNEVQTRPLDYDYLRDLPPAAQRFYELIGYQIYAVLKHERPRARLFYSDFCTRAPQTRYFDWEHVRKQMYKIHTPHLKSGYLAKVEFQELQGESGELDWLMLYTPGSKAKTEFRAFTQPKKASPAKPSRELEPAELFPLREDERSLIVSDSLIKQLLKFGISEAKARNLVESHREAAEAQIAAYPYRDMGKPKKNAAGWLVAAIEGNYTLPALYLEEQEKKQQALKGRQQKSGIENCALCDGQGWRRVKSEQYPNGAMKRCSHDLQTEAKYQDA